MIQRITRIMLRAAALLAVVFLTVPSAIGQTIRLNVEAGGNLPLSKFADTYGVGPTARVGGEIFVMDGLSALLTTGYTRWPVREEVGADLLRASSLPGSISVEGSLRNIPFEFGLRYYTFGPDYDWYLGIVAGWHNLHGSADVRYEPGGGSPVATANVAEGWSSSGYEVRLGASMPIDLNWRAHLVLAFVEIADWDHELIPRTVGGPSNPDIPSVRSLTLTVGFSYGSAF